jgi:hypothetical protein
MTEPALDDIQNWREVPAAERRDWWNQLWLDANTLARRYRLALRTGWWQDAIQVEALQAYAAWLRLYDTGTFTDPPGKLQLLFELERLRALLRGGEEPFDPARDRPRFDQYLTEQNTGDDHEQRHRDPNHSVAHRIAQELTATVQRLGELREREHLLREERSHLDRTAARGQPNVTTQELDQLARSISRLEHHERKLRTELDEHSDH